MNVDACAGAAGRGVLSARRAWLGRLAVLLSMGLLQACGDGDSPPPPGPPEARAPTISTAPADLSVDDGQGAGFSVVAEGDAPLQYQWRRDGTDIAGATSNNYSFVAAYGDTGAKLSVQVRNGAGAVTSREALLTVLPVLPVIAAQPQSASVLAGDSATFFVTFQGGTSPVQLQWQRGGADIAGANDASLTLAAVGVADDGASLRVVARNPAGSVTSAAATLRVVTAVQAPAIATAPQDQSVAAGQSATFTVVASGTAPLSYQWRRDGVPIAGAIAAAFTLANVAVGDSGTQLSVQVSNAAGTVLSASATLTVLPAASIALAPLAGPWGGAGYADGQGTAVRFSAPKGVAIDASGRLVIADRDNHVIRVADAEGRVSTLAGVRSSLLGQHADGPSASALFSQPGGVAIDAVGNVFVADEGNRVIRKIDTTGQVSTLAGSPRVIGTADGTGSAARFTAPRGLAIDANGNLFVADANGTVRKVTPAGVVTTVTGTPGQNSNSLDGDRATARLKVPQDIAVDNRDGRLYVVESLGNLRRVEADGSIATVAVDVGNQPLALSSVAVDAQGNLFVGATGSRVVRIEVQGTSSLHAGRTSCSSPSQGAFLDGPVGTACLEASGLALRSDGVLFATDKSHGLRRVDTAGAVTTLAGVPVGWGYADASGTDARFQTPLGVVADSQGNTFVADRFNSVIRRITRGGVVTTFAGTKGLTGLVDGIGSAARFGTPVGLAIDREDNLYVIDDQNKAIRKITPAAVVSTIAGSASSSGSIDGPVATARFQSLGGIAVDDNGAIYVTEWSSHIVRKIAGGAVSTLAGTAGQSGTADGMGSAARFREPRAVAVGPDGMVYVADTRNATIRRITPSGEVTTFVGQPGQTGLGVDGVGSAARTYAVQAIARVGSEFYVLDGGLRRMTAAAEITTVVANSLFGIRLGSLLPTWGRAASLAPRGPRELVLSLEDAHSVMFLTLP